MLRPLLCLLAFLVSSCVSAQELIEQDGFLNTRINGQLVRLETFTARMKDAPEAKLPVALITHGKPPSEGRMSDMRARLYAAHARDFARRGYLAVVVMRRGFGRSDGPAPEPVSCAAKDFTANFEAAADDLQGVLAEIAKRPDADPGRVVAIGASHGGAAALALAARNPAGLRGVINVSGGLRIEGCGRDAQLIEPISASASRAKVRTLWIYAENDATFPPAVVDRMHEAWLQGGGDVRRVRLAAFGKDGHTVFNQLTGRRAWLSEADAFLRDLGLPTWTQQDVNSLITSLGLPPRNGAGAERYLASPGEKALAKSADGKSINFQFGAPTLEEARKRALHNCESREPKQTCEIVAENNVLTSNGRWLLQSGAKKPVDERRD